MISHRGYWHSCEEQNRRIAIERLLDLGSSIETDLRDSNRTVVISHEPSPSGPDAAISLDAFLALCTGRGPGLMLALDIKDDGPQAAVREALDHDDARGNALGFDMSVSDTLGYLAAGKEVCLVSPQLHRRGHCTQWGRRAADPAVTGHDRFFLCTDFPEDARKFFHA